MSKRKIRIFLIIIIVCLIGVLINTIIICKNIKNKDNNKYQSKENKIIEQLNEDTIIPGNSYLFFGKYANGEIEPKQIYEEIDYFVKKIIPKYSEVLGKHTKQDIFDYYNNNKEEIMKYMEIENEESFYNFILNITENANSKYEVESVKFMEGELKHTTISTTGKLEIKYKDCKPITINIKVYMKNQDSGRNILFY